MPSFYDQFRACADRWPDNIALEIQGRDRTESYTYAEVRRMAESVGHWLLKNGLHAGDRAAILADNHPFWVATYLGVIVAGCTVVPLDTALTAGQVAILLKDSGSSLLFCGSKYLEGVQQAVTALPIRFVRTDLAASVSTNDTSKPHVVANLEAIFAAGSEGFSPPGISSDAIAALLYTSGTTADPKGVMLTHANLLGEVDAVFSSVNIGPEDALLGVLPLFHVLSQMANLLLPLVKGSRVVYLETLNTTELLRALAERNITAFAVVPQFFYLIHERIFKEIEKRGAAAKALIRFLMAFTRFARKFGWNPGRIFFAKIHALFGQRMRYLVTGGSRFDAQIGRDFQSLGIDILQAYGLTETSAAAYFTRPDNNVIGSVGPALAGVKGRIVDPEAQENGPPVGEIAIRGAIVMKGYWNRPDATAEVLRDGWLLTGDLGYFDDGSNLFITGRRKELIILSNGKNIYPEEVEAHYLRSPYIKELCVIGLEGRPGDPYTDKLHAVIVPNFEALKQRKIVNAKEVIRYDIESFSASLPSTKRIGSYEIWQEDLPRTTTRKLKRFEIGKRVQENRSRLGPGSDQSTAKPLTAEDQQWLSRPAVQQALAIIQRESRAKHGSIAPNDNLELDLGLDSMQRVELLTALEEQSGGNVDEARLAEIYTVKELVSAVLESAARCGGRGHVHVGWQSILKEEPTEADVLALGQPQPFREAFLFVFSRLIQLFCLDRFELKVEGLEKLPTSGPFILSSNHQSYIDPFVMTCVVPYTIFSNLFSVGTSEIFGTGLMRRVARWLRVIVVDPDANLVPAMRAGAYGLRHGRVLILYPEGERSIDGPPKLFKKGAAILAIHMQVPIVPVAIDGFEKVWPRAKPFQGFFPLRLRFGDPICPPPESDASESAYDSLTADVKTRVVAMWQELRSNHRS
jgi:long-chain acyl-CoA synthetase